MRKKTAELHIAGRLLDNIQNNPEKTAYIINNVRTSYADMGDMAHHIASGLAENIGPVGNNLPHPIRVAINLPRDSHYVSCIVATMLLHCSYIPIDVKIPSKRKKYMVEDAQVSFIIDESNIHNLLNAKVSSDLPDYSQPLSEAYMIYTSGTTGVPKGVSIPYSALCSYLQTVSQPDYANISANSVVLQFASIGFDASIFEIMSPLYYGATMVIAQEEERYNCTKLYNLINDQHVTFCVIPPSLVPILPDVDFPGLDAMGVGGELTSRSAIKRVLERGHYRLINVYGPTECTVVSTIHEYKSEDEWKLIGKPLPGLTCYVVNDEGELVSPGEEGELLIGGGQVANGYWNRHDLTEKAFRNNPFSHDGTASRIYYTGDRVILNENGNLEFIGRMDSQVKLHGYRIEIGDIVSRIEYIERVEKAVVRVETLGNDKYLVAYVSTKDGNPDLSDIKNHLKQNLPDYMIPSYWNCVEKFALTLNGKIDTTQLNNGAWKKHHSNVTALNENEKILAKEVASIIGVDDVNVDIDIIDELGLTSLQIMRIPQDLEPCGFKVTVDDIYTHRTIRRIADNHLYRLSFWYNNPDEHPERQVMIFFTGHPHFGYCEELCKQFTDKYNIFVIESFHSILNFMNITTPELIGIYKLLVKPVEEKYDVAVYIGYCLGGEQALLVAHDLHNETTKKPLVTIIDGEVKREKNTKHIIHLTWPTFTESQNARRCLIDDTLQITYPENVIYNGPVISFVCSEFDEQQTMTPEEQKNVPAHIMDYYRYRFRLSASLWREEYPHADVIMIDGSHFTCMHKPSCLKTVSDCIHNVHLKPISE